MSKFQIIIIALLGLILTVIAIPVGLMFWGAWGDAQFFHNAGGAQNMTEHQRQMIKQGYILNSADHYWYPLREVLTEGCHWKGTVWNATIYSCAQPLTDGIRDHQE